jgi:hypothetical protein
VNCSVPMARREGWSRLRREGSVIRGCSGRVKERCTKQRQEAPHVKVARPCEETLEALYDAGSYCYTLVKCLKPFVRNGKGVIEVDDHAQGPPINSDPLVMERHTLMRRELRRLQLISWLSFPLSVSSFFHNRSSEVEVSRKG